ncbi:MAG: TorF family putative porin [Alphaproteobacteria bacterium]|nr:TorF family putative porin [Alphaproteobacteria bacterium]MBU0792655.1 TorF family putative porin [Alphaproteobacteria bacterium]MBU0875630.1 TorF family putative porin [Alphaproteobacteria bacterium]MBU1771495.1 TorF family putative porin [Alphaproteobacteria bacterium]
MRKSILGLSALAILATATPALAQDDASGLTVSGSATLVSDYRFRGFSQTKQNAAVQAGITVSHDSGFYFGTWGSNVDFPDLDGAGNGATAEVDFFAGYSTDLAPGVSVDFGLLYYLYPKDTVIDVATDYFEPYVTLSTELGPVGLALTANYAWKQEALGDNDSFYLKAAPSLAIPGTPFSVDGHIGYGSSDSFLGGVDGEVFDWSAGVSASWQALTFGVRYVDTDEPGQIRGSDAAVVFSLGASF